MRPTTAQLTFFVVLLSLATLGRCAPSPSWLAQDAEAVHPTERSADPTPPKPTTTSEPIAVTEQENTSTEIKSATPETTASAQTTEPARRLLTPSFRTFTAPPTPLTDESPAANDGVRVASVVDGDTITLETGERVRYIGVDTPETYGTPECFGTEAKERNRTLVEGRTVRLVADVEDRDKYGRLLRYVWVGDSFVNDALVRDGYASTLTIPPNIAYADTFRLAAADARAAGRGLWNACGTTEQRTAPSLIPQSVAYDCPADRPIKGNAQSQIYHLPDGEYYAKTKPEQCFAAEAEAQAAGYRKSRK
ncbi:MAG: thermonuclease family protein [Patescibacteria group bacterium]|jgi:micrococcal nuclease